MKIYSVSELNNEARETILLKFEYPISVKGEMTDYRESKGHQYFKLRDNNTSHTISCVMWKNSANAHNLSEYLHSDVIVTAQVDFYVGFGQFQLNIIEISEFGEGFLRKEIEKIKNKLLKEGVFDNKKEIPTYPNKIGILTAKDSHALRDVISKLGERYPISELFIFPSTVQGPTASKSLIKQLKNANDNTDIDVLLIVRGGGSLQDLMAFNDEDLVREISNSRIPTITGIGHKPDVTLSDYASDSSQETPTAAAVKCVPDKTMLKQDIIQNEIRLENKLESILENISNKITNYLQLLKSYNPARILELYSKRLNESQKALIKSINIILKGERENLVYKNSEYKGVLESIKMKHKIYNENIVSLTKSLKLEINHYFRNQDNKLKTYKQNITQLNPENILKRGYTMIWDDKGKIISTHTDVLKYTDMYIQFIDGKVKVTRKK